MRHMLSTLEEMLKPPGAVALRANWSGVVTVERPFAARGGHPPRGRFGSTFESAAIVNDRSDTFSWVHMLQAIREMINTHRTA